ncbi:MAG: hypothetical protein OEY29_14425 [Gammaproteobacteria bacterium]|nr:hypothetical protein [Gammaproteobacteria bacterium]
MKIPLIGGFGVAANTGGTNANFIGEAASLGEEYTQNWYISKEQGSKHGFLLRPTPGYTSTAVSPTSGTGCTGGIAIDTDDYLVFGISIFKSGVKKADFSSAPSNVVMAHSGTATNRQIIIAVGKKPYCYSISYDTMWELDGTSTTNVDSTATAGTTGATLVDTATNFVTANVKLGMTVHNYTDDTWAFVTAITTTTNPNDTITLSSDIGLASGESYEIAASYTSSGASVSSGSITFNPKTVAYMDGYFVADEQTASTDGRFYISALRDGTRWNALDFATAERDPDKLQAVFALNRELWLIGTRTTEIWYNSGNSDFPFAPIQSGFIQYGAVSPYVIARIGDRILWFGVSSTGGRFVLMSDGLGVRVVSTPEISKSIKNYVTTSYATSYSYEGNDFYCLTDGTNTFVYNLTTNLWHRWKSDLSTTNYRHDARVIISVGGDDYRMGHRSANERLTMQPTYPYEDTTKIQRIRRSKIIHNNGTGMTFHAVQVDMDEATAMALTTTGGIPQRLSDEGGVDFTSLGITVDVDYVEGSTGTQDIITAVSATFLTTTTETYQPGDSYRIIDGVTGAVIYPATGIDLRWRDSGGAWTTKKERLPNSNNKSRLIWRKCGKSFERTFEISTSAPITPVLTDGYAIADFDDREL